MHEEITVLSQRGRSWVKEDGPHGSNWSVKKAKNGRSIIELDAQKDKTLKKKSEKQKNGKQTVQKIVASDPKD